MGRDHMDEQERLSIDHEVLCQAFIAAKSGALCASGWMPHLIGIGDYVCEHCGVDIREKPTQHA